ncbi:hypothetical protein NECAME_17891 [Necator americanus]|uniref:Uncharacterized protein n=1 Tax=Necator americanus TaxID=51031 RepID=W2TKI1_NECAM|nr:hypothetical protein NECAME_17891 [Necator americanus]ETN81522.1 hypothetical protein NECAME_17891 [Necator americanus]
MLAVLIAVAVFPILYSLWTSLFDIRLTRSGLLGRSRAHGGVHDHIGCRNHADRNACRAATEPGVPRPTAVVDGAAHSLGDSVRRRRPHVEVDLRLGVRRAERCAAATRPDPSLHGMAWRYASYACADRQCVRVEGSAARDDPAACHAQVDPR